MKTVRNLCLLSLAFAAASIAKAATNCTEDQSTKILSVATEYGKTLGATCISNVCSSDCVDAITQLADLLPDCEDPNTISRQVLVDGVSWCNNATSDTSSGSSSNHTCSPAELAVVQTVNCAYNGEFWDACPPDDTCSADCQDVKQAMLKVTPDCFDSAYGGNYADATNASIAYCVEAGSEVGLRSADSGSDGNVADSVSSSTSTTVGSASSSDAVISSISAVAIAGMIAVANLLA